METKLFNWTGCSNTQQCQNPILEELHWKSLDIEFVQSDALIVDDGSSSEWTGCLTSRTSKWSPESRGCCFWWQFILGANCCQCLNFSAVIAGILRVDYLGPSADSRVNRPPPRDYSDDVAASRSARWYHQDAVDAAILLQRAGSKAKHYESSAVYVWAAIPFRIIAKNLLFGAIEERCWVRKVAVDSERRTSKRHGGQPTAVT